MKVFRRIFLLILLVLLAGLAFIYWGSLSKLNTKQYTEKIEYDVLSPQTDSVFTIITYNIGYLSGMTNNTSQNRTAEDFKARLNLVKTAFVKYKPHFIGFQEIDFNSSRSFHVNQLQELATSLDMQSAAKAVNWDKNYVPFPYYPPTQHFGEMLSGQAILSKYPIRLHDRITLSRPPNPFWYDAFYLERLAQIATINLNNQDIIVINVHLEAYDKETRQKQSETVLELYRSYVSSYPTLLIGDFNSEPPFEGNESPTLNVFLQEENLASAFPDSTFRKEGAFTYPSESPDQHIDFIFYNKNQIKPIDFQTITEAGTASDHLPVMMKFKLLNNK